MKNFHKRYDIYIANIKNDKNYATDFEISTASIILKKGIIIYKKKPNRYEFINHYTGNKNTDTDNIYMVHVNNNHFNLIYNKDINIHQSKNNLKKSEKIHTDIEKRLKKLTINDLQYSNKNSYFQKIYVAYPRKVCSNFYNEMYEYLSNNKLPKRLLPEYQLFCEKNNYKHSNIINPFFKPKNEKNLENRKKEKRKQFRKLAKYKYFIKEGRLFYRYKLKKEKKLKKIPYIYEINNIFYNAHVTDVHCTFKKSKKNILEREFYYETITADLKRFISNCERCEATRHLKKVNVPERAIINEGPRDEYQMDLWYLPPDMLKYTDFKYVIDIVDHFSKWLWSCPVKNKTAVEAMTCFKIFIFSFGKPNKLHTDNGAEYKNNLFNNFCKENGILHVFSKPYTPKSHGAVEAAHKQIKNYVLTEFYINNPEDFFLEEVLLNVINFHNNNEHSSTKYKPIDLRDIRDKELIEKVNNNMANIINFVIKYKDLYLLEPDDKLLISDNIKLKEEPEYFQIIRKNAKGYGSFIIPATFINYTKDQKIKIKICKRYKKILQKAFYYVIELELVKQVSEKGFNFYLK